jgi:hypothetical protein
MGAYRLREEKGVPYEGIRQSFEGQELAGDFEEGQESFEEDDAEIGD